MDMLILDPDAVKAYAKETGRSPEDVALAALVAGCSSWQRSHPRRTALVDWADGALAGRIVEEGEEAVG